MSSSFFSVERLQSVHLLEDELWDLRQKFEYHVGLQQGPVRSVDQLAAILRESAIIVPKAVVALLFEQCVKHPTSAPPPPPTSPPPMMRSSSIVGATAAARTISMDNMAGGLSPHLSSRTPRTSLMHHSTGVGGRSPHEDPLGVLAQQQSIGPLESFSSIRHEQSQIQHGMPANTIGHAHQTAVGGGGSSSTMSGPASARKMSGLASALAVRRAMNVLKGKAKHSAGKNDPGDGGGIAAEEPVLSVEGYLRCCTIIKRLFLCCYDEGRDAVEALVDQLKSVKPPPLPASMTFPLRQRYRQQQQKSTVQSHIFQHAFKPAAAESGRREMSTCGSSGNLAEERLDAYGVVLEDMKDLFAEENEKALSSPVASETSGGKGLQHQLSSSAMSASSPQHHQTGAASPVASPESLVQNQSLQRVLSVPGLSSSKRKLSLLSSSVANASGHKGTSQPFVPDSELLAKAINMCRRSKSVDDADDDRVGDDEALGGGGGEVSMLALRCALANFGLADDPFGQFTPGAGLSPRGTDGSSGPPAAADLDDSPIRHAQQFGHIPQLLTDPLLYATLSAADLKDLLATSTEPHNSASAGAAEQANAPFDVSDTLAGLTTTINLLRTNMKFRSTRDPAVMGGGASKQATFSADDEDEDEGGIAMIENPMTGQLEPIATESTEHPLLRKTEPPLEVVAAKRLVKLARVEQDLFMTAARRQVVNTLGRILQGNAFGADKTIVVDDGVEEEEEEEELNESDQEEGAFDDDEQPGGTDDLFETADHEAGEKDNDSVRSKATADEEHDCGSAFRSPTEHEIAISIDPAPVDGQVPNDHRGVMQSEAALNTSKSSVATSCGQPHSLEASALVIVRSPDSQQVLVAGDVGLRLPHASSMKVTIVTPRSEHVASREPTPRLTFVLPESSGKDSAAFAKAASSGEHVTAQGSNVSLASSLKASGDTTQSSGMQKRRSVTLTADDSATGGPKRRKDGVHDNASSASGLSKKLHPLLNRLRNVLLRRLQKQRARLNECGFTISQGAVLHTGITPTTDSLQTVSGRFPSSFSALEDAGEEDVLSMSTKERVAKRNAHLSAMDKQKQQQLVLENAAERHRRKLLDDRFRACDMTVDEFFFVPQMKKRSELLPFFLRKSFGPPVEATTMRSALRHRDDVDTSLSAVGHEFLRQGDGRTSSTQMAEDAERQKAHRIAMREKREKAQQEELALLNQLPMAPGIYPVVQVSDQLYNTPQPYRTSLTREANRGSAQFHAKKRLLHPFLDVDSKASERARNFEPPKWASRLYDAAATKKRLEGRSKAMSAARSAHPAKARPPAALLGSSASTFESPVVPVGRKNREVPAVEVSEPLDPSASRESSAARTSGGGGGGAPAGGAVSRRSPSPQVPFLSTPDSMPRSAPSSLSCVIPTLVIGSSGSFGGTPAATPDNKALGTNVQGSPEPLLRTEISIQPEPKEYSSLAVARGVDYLRMRRQMRQMMHEEGGGRKQAVRPSTAPSESAVNLSLSSDPNKSVVVSVAGVGHVLENSWFKKERASVLKHALCKALGDAGGPRYLNL